MPNELERRSLVRPVEERSEGDSSTVAGYAVVFDSEADICGYFREVIKPGAFSDALKNGDVRAYFGHDRNRVLGRQSAGTLRLKEDDKGLAVEIDLPDTTDGRDAKALIQRGDISGMSFGFCVTHEEWDETQDPPLRTIHQVDLREVSIVSEPAYDDTSIAMRSLEAARAQLPHPAHNRIAIRRARMEMKLRGINPDTE